MQNRPLPDYHRRQPDRDDPRQGWNLRLVTVFAVFAAAFLAIGVRLAWIQTRLQDSYIAGFNVTRVELEPIPGRDGRIVTDDTVLAADVVRYDVEAHYRWIERPANRAWLTQKARARLPRGRLKDSAVVEVARRQVLADRQAAWERLASMVPGVRAELSQRRDAIQRRVERIASSVNRRRRQRQVAPDQSEPKTIGEWLAWVRTALTSQPERNSDALIIVREEVGYHSVASDVSLAVAAEIRAHPELYPGFRIRESTARTYPQATLAAHVVGIRSQSAHAGLLQHRSGRSGVERSWDGRLRGIDGQRRLVLNRRGEVIRSQIVREPISGRDVVLTINARLQRTAEQLLDEALAGTVTTGEPDDPPQIVPTGGCIIALDVHSGEVLALANAPRFDLRQMVRPDAELWQRTLDDPRHPLFPRATQMTVPPGSVYKVLTAIAGLQASAIDPAQHIFCQGFLDQPDRHRCYIFRHYGVGHGEIDMRGALAQSCNVYFFRLARKMGPGPIVEWSHRFAFGQPTGIDLPFERGGNVPQPQRQGDRASRWYPGDTLGLAIGQSRLTVTPLQVARMMAAIANGGYLVRPHVVDAQARLTDGSEGGGMSWSAKPRQKIRGLDPNALEQVRSGLFSAVQDEGGTAYRSTRLDSIAIAGKTGTAEVGGGRPDHAWFAGYAPAGQPQVAFVVMLEHGGSGGSAAGPLARELVKRMQVLGLLPGAQVARTP